MEVPGAEGQTKEMRLTRMVEGLRKKVDQLKLENSQLEDLLRQADASSHGDLQQNLYKHICFSLAQAIGGALGACHRSGKWGSR